MAECVCRTEFLLQCAFSHGKFQSREESGKEDQSPLTNKQEKMMGPDFLASERGFSLSVMLGAILAHFVFVIGPSEDLSESFKLLP